MSKIELPELPPMNRELVNGYTKHQMQIYAEAAVLEERKKNAPLMPELPDPSKREELFEFIRAAVLAGREACAKLCNELELSLDDGCESDQPGYWPDQIAYKCAKAIRERSKEQVMSREAMQVALSAIEDGDRCKAIQILEAAIFGLRLESKLAKPEQEPGAWMYVNYEPLYDAPPPESEDTKRLDFVERKYYLYLRGAYAHTDFFENTNSLREAIDAAMKEQA